MAKTINKALKEAEKLQKKEEKNPGKENKEKWKEFHNGRRGETIPVMKVVQTEEEKQLNNRTRRNRDYKKQVRDYLDR